MLDPREHSLLNQLSRAHMGSQRPEQQVWSLHGLYQILCMCFMVVSSVFCGTPISGKMFIPGSFACSWNNNKKSKQMNRKTKQSDGKDNLNFCLISGILSTCSLYLSLSFELPVDG